jgi:hypothetical protein
MKKKIVSLLILLATTLNLQGCTDGEIAVGAGLIGVIIGIGIGSGHDHGSCHGGYVRRCTDWRDSWGNYRHECREEWDSCARRHTPLAKELQAVTDADTVTHSIANTAEKYKLSFDAAEKLTLTIQKVQKGDLSKLADIGLAKTDLELIAKGERITDKGIIGLSDSLNQDIGDTQRMLNSITEEAKARKAAAAQ